MIANKASTSEKQKQDLFLDFLSSLHQERRRRGSRTAGDRLQVPLTYAQLIDRSRSEDMLTVNSPSSTSPPTVDMTFACHMGQMAINGPMDETNWMVGVAVM